MRVGKEQKQFLLFHAGAVAAVAMFPLYRFLAANLPKFMGRCFFHDFLFLYCPLCGGTRAVNALLHFRITEALQCNAYVVLVVISLLVADLAAWIRFFRGSQPYFRGKATYWVILAVLLLVFGVLRNYLLIVHGIDPLGDLSEIRSLIQRH